MTNPVFWGKWEKHFKMVSAIFFPACLTLKKLSREPEKDTHYASYQEGPDPIYIQLSLLLLNATI